MLVKYAVFKKRYKKDRKVLDYNFKMPYKYFCRLIKVILEDIGVLTILPVFD